ncbi:hypothetical protein BBO_06841 [Beauveria brongniartii RCEF 3172]|uniref:Uncharacterized protein n=1 Tax=Beauveria brongniartii RCEF 3172 TaxID=1081107 RepID=A0A162J3M4_9HYPO|nr:hypothetical protein BBO_06841 [Beauveria brongniartii RCEF 3172]
MSFTSRTVWRLASTVAAGAALVTTSIYVSRTTWRIAAGSKLGITDENTALLSFIDSPTISNHVNPQRKESRAVDTHTVTLHVPLNKGISDETILAQATKNFFNGWVFYLEAKALNLIKLQDGKYSSMFFPNTPKRDLGSSLTRLFVQLELASTTVPAHIWNAAKLSETSLPELHTVLFGVFRLADVHLADDDATGDSSSTTTTQSHADFLFGSDLTQFAGCHRLSVQRQEVDAVGGTQKVQVQLQCYACNPQSDAPANGILLGFHRLYASALFRETAGQMYRWLHPDNTAHDMMKRRIKVHEP